MGFQPRLGAVRLLRGGLGRQCIGKANEPQSSLTDFLGEPRHLFVNDHSRRRRYPRHFVRVRDHSKAALILLRFAEPAAFNPQRLHDLLQGRLDLRIDLIGRKIDRSGGTAPAGASPIAAAGRSERAGRIWLFRLDRSSVRLRLPRRGTERETPPEWEASSETPEIKELPRSTARLEVGLP